MDNLITAITSLVYTAPATTGGVPGGAVGWVTQFVGLIMDTPLLLMFALIPVVGFGIGALRRLISIN